MCSVLKPVTLLETYRLVHIIQIYFLFLCRIQIFYGYKPIAVLNVAPPPKKNFIKCLNEMKIIKRKLFIVVQVKLILLIAYYRVSFRFLFLFFNVHCIVAHWGNGSRSCDSVCPILPDGPDLSQDETWTQWAQQNQGLPVVVSCV